MLRRRITLLQAVSLNMSMMIGVGPFIAVPLLLGTMGGPQALLGCLLGAIVAIADGMIWSELAAAYSGSGGTFSFIHEIYGNGKLGRCLKFLFVWQFIFSGPLELASGVIGATAHASFLWPALDSNLLDLGFSVPGFRSPIVWKLTLGQVASLGLVGLLVAAAYRKVEDTGRLMVILWIGVLGTVGWVMFESLRAFDPRLALDFPPGAWSVNRSFVFGLGAALSMSMYTYLGYYQVCYLGDEVEDPPRVIPRAVVISLCVISIMYFVMFFGIIGVIPWRDAVKSTHVVSDLMLKLSGGTAAMLVSLLILWTALAGCFAGLLGYSRVLYAAAREGRFFRGLAAVHPTGGFPHVALLLIGFMTAIACLGDIGAVIEALMTTRILVQFITQIVMIFYIRSRKDLLGKMPFLMPLYPVPAILALVGWLWVFGSASYSAITYGLVTLAIGLALFVLRDTMIQRRSSRIDSEGGSFE